MTHRFLHLQLTCLGVDYPFEENEEGANFMDEIKKSGLVTQEGYEMIAYRNAQKLLKLDIARS